MPRARKRRWVRFVRKTNAVIDKHLAPSFLIRTRAGAANATVDKQNVVSIHTVLGGHSANLDTRDLAALTDQVQAMSTIGAFEPDKFKITGWMAETQIFNASDITVYIDCYYWRCKRNVPLTLAGVDTSIAEVFSNALSSLEDNFPAGGSSLDVLDYGVTPFNTATFAKFINIYRKQRIKLGPGGVTQLEQRSGRNYFLQRHYNDKYGLIQGKSEGIMFVFYGTPVADTGTGSIAGACKVRFASNFNYTYRVMLAAAQTGGTTQA